MTPGKKLMALAATAAGIVLVAVAVAAVGNQPAGAAPPGAAPVVVTNSASEPVPTVITGPVDVGTPTVNIGNSPTVSVGNVPTVRIDPSVPVGVRTVQPKRVAKGAAFGFAVGEDRKGGFSIQVPSGRRLVVEQASCVISVPTGQIPFVEVSSDDDTYFWYPLTKVGAEPGRDTYVGTQLVRLTIDGPKAVGVTMHRRITTGEGDGLCNLVGYETDLE